jgi:antitoxin component of MazEF toxin-antitoxin module
MEATVIRIGNSLGFSVPERIINDYNIKVGTRVEMDFKQNGYVVLREKSKVREGWADAFALYAREGEDMPLLPDFLDTETNTFL